MFKEGCRIEVFADELRRRSEENQRNAQSDSTTLSERSIIDIDNSTAENLAKEKNLWIDISEVVTLGTPDEATFTNGDVLVILKTKDISYGDLCCASWQNKTLLKRVIGMPGDSIDIDSEGDVYVNNELLDEPYVKEKSIGKCESELPCQVPEDKYYLLGDQRENSSDSRNPDVGCVSEDQIIGRVMFRIWPLK